MRMLRELLDCLRPRTQGEQALRAMFASIPQLLKAIHLEEVGLPNGKSTTVQWMLAGQSAKLRICVRDRRSEKIVWQNFDRSAQEFTQLLRAVRELDSDVVDGEASQIRDGVVYFIGWGEKDNLRSLTVRNPNSSSKQQKIVTAIKSSIDQREAETAGQATLPKE